MGSYACVERMTLLPRLSNAHTCPTRFVLDPLMLSFCVCVFQKDSLSSDQIAAEDSHAGGGAYFVYNANQHRSLKQQRQILPVHARRAFRTIALFSSRICLKKYIGVAIANRHCYRRKKAGTKCFDDRLSLSNVMPKWYCMVYASIQDPHLMSFHQYRVVSIYVHVFA